jgi:3'(2'), 5'-bisphosphate nucleotidase
LHSFEPRHGNLELFRSVVETLGVGMPAWPMDSQAKHVVLAGGAADVLLRFPTQRGFHDAIWDQAAGTVLVEEAGGRVTDLLGRALDFSSGRHLVGNEGLVASNAALHDAVLDAVRIVLRRHSRPGR